MLKDITLGQFFPGTSPIHRLDPRSKLLALIVYIVALFMSKGPVSYGLCIVSILVVIALSRIAPKMILRSLRPVLILVVFTGLINLVYTPGDTVWSFWFISVTRQGLFQALFLTMRIVLLIAASSLLTYTTSPISLTDAIENLLSPLKKIRVPVHEFAMMMTIALRMIPTLIEETDKIMSAQKSRGADFETGNLVRRAKALIPVLVPLFISSFRRATELATAMECRLYQGGDGRTRLHTLRYAGVDALGGALVILVCGAIITFSRFGL